MESSVCFPFCIVQLMTPDHMSHLKTQDSPCKTNISLVKFLLILLLLSGVVCRAPGALLCLRWLFIFSKLPSQRCTIYPGRRTLWFMVAGVENYADTVWHCKSTASSPLPLSSVFKMHFSRVPSAPSPLHKEKKECRRETMSLSLSVLQFSLRSFFLLEVSSPPLPIAALLCVSAAVPSKQNHATLSDVICSSLLLFHKLRQWHPGVSLDGVSDILDRVTSTATQGAPNTPSGSFIVRSLFPEISWWRTTV